MRKQNLYILYFISGIASLIIAMYQFYETRVLDGVLSIIFALILLFGGTYNLYRIKNKRMNEET
jgi:hypothetical protein